MAEYGEGADQHAYEIAEPSDGPYQGEDMIDWTPDLRDPTKATGDSPPQFDPMAAACAQVTEGDGWQPSGRIPNEWDSKSGARLRITYAIGEACATFLPNGYRSMATWQRAIVTRRFRVRGERDLIGLSLLLVAFGRVGGIPGAEGGSTERWNATPAEVTAAATEPKASAQETAGERLPFAPYEHGVVIRDQTEMRDSGMLPARAHSTDAGLDLYTVGDWEVLPGAWVDIPCGIRAQLPDHVWGMITGRSSTLRKLGLLVPLSVIDPGYRGPLFVQVWNLGKERVLVKDKQRVGQLILIPNVTPLFSPEWVAAVADSDRGGNGFGSSGS